jgi:KaiC/GvpD/RAD55 family RecA-like ATPase
LGQIVTTKFKSGRYRGVRGVTYSLSSQIMAYGFQTIYKLVKQALRIAKRGGFFSLSVLNPRMFNETIITSFEHLLDGVIALEMKELDDRFQRRIRIKKSPITGFSTKIVSYDIEDSRPHLQKQPD